MQKSSTAFTLIPYSHTAQAKATLILLVCVAFFGGKWGAQNINIGHLVALVVGAYLVWELKRSDDTQSTEFNVKMEKQLVALDPDNKYPYLIADLELLHLLSLSLPLQTDNEVTFAEMMTAVNSYLESVSIIECTATDDPSIEFDSLTRYRDLICNLYHTLVYQIDDNSNVKDMVYQRCLDKIRVHLNKQLEVVRKEIVQKQSDLPVSIRTKFLPHLNRPRPLDANTDTSLVERNFHFF